MANTPRQINLVTSGVSDYCTPLFNDQFGNYVIQGSLTVLKILNLRGGEEEALSKNKIIHAIFDGPISSDSILFQILDEGNYGPTFIYKVLTSRILDNSVRDEAITKIRQLILNSNSNLQSRQLLEKLGYHQQEYHPNNPPRIIVNSIPRGFILLVAPEAFLFPV
ncbi:CGH_1_collapsed_G0015420.mRNA.1.CDS.1 [Saccharomyces cerevisiae]|nr:CGH_1_collapsed_G0015420.mRNA.1.CDS.1 [Saccharomyces cerevisiae]